MTLEVSATVLDAPRSEEDGAIFLTVTGTPPYSFLWSDGSSGSSLTARAGAYSVTVSDATASVTKTYAIREPDAFDVESYPYDVALLSDFGARDLYSRTTRARKVAVTARVGDPLVTFERAAIPGGAASAPVGEWTMGAEGVALRSTNAAGAMMTVMEVTESGASFAGGLETSAVAVGASLDLDPGAFLFFARRIWRVWVDGSDEDALLFQKWDATSGEYVTKLALV